MMTAADVIEVYCACSDEGVTIWVDGGWAVDALLQEQTRSHNDLDIAVQQKDLPRLHELLARRGYRDIARDDTSPWNFVLGDPAGHEIDVHVIVLDADGNGSYGPKERGEMYPAASLMGEGTILNQKVRCISAEWIVRFKMPYIEKEKNRRDIDALRKRFEALKQIP
jgi:lincosamide nucleotidyltransferase A/C/D/E